jgi:hypothetical protein
MILVIRFTTSIAVALVLILLILETVKVTVTEYDFVNERDIETEEDYSATRPDHDFTRPISTTIIDDKSSKRLQNLRLVFLGDSVTRYQYLSLAYYLRYGYWYDTTISPTVSNLMNAHSFHHPFHPNEDWNEFFIQSNRILHPFEICDCIRGSGMNTSYDILVERRYFYDDQYNNMLVYINMNGNETSPGRGYYGRLTPNNIFGPNFHTLIGIVPGLETYQNNDESRRSVIWEYATWDDVIRYHIGLLDLNFNRSAESSGEQSEVHALLNAGLHPHDFHNPSTAQNLVNALRDVQIIGTWKTTTYTKEYVLQKQSVHQLDILDDTIIEQGQTQHNNVTSTLLSDALMCEVLHSHCLNVSWIGNIQSPSKYYVDNLHYVEPVYRIMNEEYLQKILPSFPNGYMLYNRSKILRLT